MNSDRPLHWACRECGWRNCDEDGPVCENCETDNSRGDEAEVALDPSGYTPASSYDPDEIF